MKTKNNCIMETKNNCIMETKNKCIMETKNNCIMKCKPVQNLSSTLRRISKRSPRSGGSKLNSVA
jgi:hypothetical protein